jgi:hypothetical protein
MYESMSRFDGICILAKTIVEFAGPLGPGKARRSQCLYYMGVGVGKPQRGKVLR